MATSLGAFADRVASRLRSRPPRGVNVVGYFDRTSGLADRARQLAESLRLAGSEVSEWTVPSDGTDELPNHPVYDTTIAVVTAVQLAGVIERVPAPFERARRRIGYFFWELSHVPDEQRWGIGLTDEIWTPTEFVRAAYADATDRPVRLVPLPVAAPRRAGRGRDAFGFDADAVVLLVSFDVLSSMERKNPAGAISAFRRAFPIGDEPVRLVVKTLNGSDRPDDLARLSSLAGRDPRIEIRDELLEPEVMADMISAADVFVSLHRSEGLGLQIAEAMWLGTPVIATRYSGNLDMLDDDTALLVDAELIPVSGGGEAYTEGTWADPDPDQAADAMRRLATDAGLRASIVAAARARMIAQADTASQPLRDALAAARASPRR